MYEILLNVIYFSGCIFALSFVSVFAGFAYSIIKAAINEGSEK
jgi:hypothetical protein